MRVLFISEELDLPERHLLLGLRRAGLDLSVMTDPDDRAIGALRDAGVRVLTIRLGGRVDLRAIRCIRVELKTHAYDIMHCLRNNRPLANGLLASRGISIHRVAYRGIIGHLHRYDPASWMTYLNPRVDRIVCVCEAVRQYLLSLGLPPARPVTIYKGHVPEWYEPASRSALSEFNIPGDAFVVGCAATMRPRKGIDVLIAALEHIPVDSNVHLLLAGKVADAKIHRLAEDRRFADKVHLAGFRNDGPALMGCCDVFCMPSLRREGLPRAVLEAMAQGIPAVVTDVGGNPEIVEDGVSGRVVPPLDARSLAHAIMELKEDQNLRARLSERARQRIEEKFSTAKTVRQTLDLYGSL